MLDPTKQQNARKRGKNREAPKGDMEYESRKVSLNYSPSIV